MKKEQASLVTITDKANNHLSGIVVKNKVKGVSLSVDGGGCAGFNYKWNLLKEHPKDAEENDKIELNEGFLYIDPFITMYILGTQIDFIDDIAGSYLKIVNPNATSECGCGESFSV
jgi:iron-sulfur cluster assembly accessory protein